MKKILYFLSFVISIMLTASMCFAATAQVQVTEPTTNADGTPLSDLSHCNIYYDIGVTNTFTKDGDIPATSPTGGGTLTKDISIPVADNTSVDVVFKATCSDSSGNESGFSNEVTKTYYGSDTNAPDEPVILLF